MLKILVVGAGGVGGYFGGRLLETGLCDIIFLLRNSPHNSNGFPEGLHVESTKGDFTIKNVKTTTDPKSIEGPVDVIIFAVKTWQVEETAKSITHLIGEKTIALPLENGLESPKILKSIFGTKPVIGALCRIVSFAIAPGHIAHRAVDPEIIMGSYSDTAAHVEPMMKQFHELLLQCKGMKVVISNDIDTEIWKKFVFVTVVSSVGGVTRAPLSVVFSHPETSDMFCNVAEEMRTLAQAFNINAITKEFIQEYINTVKRTAKQQPGYTSSVMRDIFAGKPSEIRDLLGVAVKLGKEANLNMPLCNFIYTSVILQEMKARGEVEFPKMG